MIDLDAEAMKKAAFAVFAKANEKHLSQDKIEALWPSQHHPHWNGLAEAAVRSYMKEPWTRDDLAKGLAMLDGIVLQEIKSTVGDPSDANNWREYLGRADDLLAHLSASCAPLQAPIPPAGSDAGEADGNEDELSAKDLAMIDQAWENHKAALPVATVIDDNQPDRTAIIEITIDPPTLPVGTKLYAEPKAIAFPTVGEITEAQLRMLRKTKAVELLRGPLSMRAPSAEFNEWSARDIVEYIDALEAALTRLPDAGWRSMDSAPKEECLIIVGSYNAKKQWCCEVWSTVNLTQEQERSRSGFYKGSEHLEWLPTHWTPLPPLPDALPDTGRE